MSHHGEDALKLYFRREWGFWCVCAGLWHYSRQAVRMEVARATAAVAVPMMPRVRERADAQAVCDSLRSVSARAMRSAVLDELLPHVGFMNEVMNSMSTANSRLPREL